MSYSRFARALIISQAHESRRRFTAKIKEACQLVHDTQEACEEMSNGRLKKVCFVTIGATAKFDQLIISALSEPVLEALADNNFTDLNIQYGNSEALFNAEKPDDHKGLAINGFDFDFKEGLKKYMRATQELSRISKGGLVVCHAGAGTVLDAMRLGLKIIVVPNDSLLNNHQVELAEVLRDEGYVSMASTSTLAATIRATCSKDEKQWAGATGSLAGVVDDMLGYEPDERENDSKQRLG